MKCKVQVSIGDEVDVNRNVNGRKPQFARGRVAQLYPRFAVIEIRSGYRESWEYDRLTVVRRTRQRAG